MAFMAKVIALSLLWVAVVTTLAGRMALVGADSTQEKPAQPAPAPSYKEDILPLLQAKCLRCHGGKRPKGELDLSTPGKILKGGESGAVIIPGKPKQSIL